MAGSDTISHEFLIGARVEAMLLDEEGTPLHPTAVKTNEPGGFEIGPFDKFTALLPFIGAPS